MHACMTSVPDIVPSQEKAKQSHLSLSPHIDPATTIVISIQNKKGCRVPLVTCKKARVNSNKHLPSLSNSIQQSIQNNGIKTYPC